MWDSDSSGWDWQRSNTWSWSRPSQTIWSWSGAPLGQVAHCYLISIFGHFWIITAAVLFLISRAARMMLGWLMMLEFISWLEWMRICPHLRLPVMLTAHQEFSLAENLILWDGEREDQWEASIQVTWSLSTNQRSLWWEGRTRNQLNGTKPWKEFPKLLISRDGG